MRAAATGPIRARSGRSVDRHLEPHGVGLADRFVRRRAAPAAEAGSAEIVAPLHPVAGQRGVLALAGGRPLALDVFDRPDTLASLWPGLVGSYAADALVAPSGPGGRAAAPPMRRRWWRPWPGARPAPIPPSAWARWCSSPPTYAVVSALVVGAALVHLAALWAPGRPVGRGSPASGSRAAALVVRGVAVTPGPPSRRRWFHGGAPDRTEPGAAVGASRGRAGGSRLLARKSSRQRPQVEADDAARCGSDGLRRQARELERVRAAGRRGRRAPRPARPGRRRERRSGRRFRCWGSACGG